MTATAAVGKKRCVQDGKLLKVDLEDCTLMGYKVFGVIVNKESVGDIQYTTKGKVAAYVQFQQQTPEGIKRLSEWPVELFRSIAPPALR